MPDSNPATPMPKTHAVQCREEGRPQDWWLFKAMTPEGPALDAPLCAHCNTGPHPDPAWRNLLSRAALKRYFARNSYTHKTEDVYLHSNCIAEYLHEHHEVQLAANPL